MVNPFLFNKKIDLVDFGDVQLFMFQNDNLYDISVSADRKNQSVIGFQQKISKSGYPSSPVTPQNLSEIVSARYGTYLYLNHLWQNSIDFTILDVGCFVGSFSVKLGNFVRTFKKATKIIAFDPTEAGALVSYNIELNGLNNIVKHEALAVSNIDGLVLFRGVSGHADATALNFAPTSQVSSLKKIKNMIRAPLREKYDIVKRRFSRVVGALPGQRSFDLIAASTRLTSYLRTHNIYNHLFVKIDVEGFDAAIIEQLLPLMSEGRLISIIFEFTPGWYNSIKDAEDYLSTLSQTFHLFDLFYAPNPTRFRPITPEEIRRFVDTIQTTRKYRFTDIFLLDKRTPNCAQILSRLSSLQEDPEQLYTL